MQRPIEKGCWNCEHSTKMCGMLLCKWHEGYVNDLFVCSWWYKKSNEKAENK